jgi:hypothetical protein
MLARHFILPFAWEDRRGEALSKSCLAANPKNRPTIMDIALKLGVTKEETVSVPRRYMKWSLVAAVVLVSLVGITVSLRDSIGDARDKLVREVAREQEDVGVAIARMHTLWADNQARRDEFAGDIAKLKRSSPLYGLTLLTERDRRPMAIFHLMRRPLAYLENSILEIGDWVIVDGKEGFVLDIDKRALVLDVKGERVEFEFEKAGFTPKMNFTNTSGVVIWDKPGNLPALVQSLRKIARIPHEEAAFISGPSSLTTLSRYEPEKVQVADDLIFGFYIARSLPEFLSVLDQQLSVEIRQDHLHISKSKDSLSLHLPYSVVRTGSRELKNLQQLCDLFSGDFEAINATFVPETGSASMPLPPMVFENQTYQSILTGLGLAWNIDESVDGAVEVVVK